MLIPVSDASLHQTCVDVRRIASSMLSCCYHPVSATAQVTRSHHTLSIATPRPFAAGFPSNVSYEEVDLPAVPYPLRRYLPYAWYRARVPPPMRAVVLVAQRDIREGEELFSNYFTVVRGD